MKCTIPEISWHNREPVLSVDIHPVTANFYRVATGGGDSHVLIWQMIITENGAVKQEVISDLTRHQKAVNCVRWSPSGQYLASGDDDANIIIWQLKTDNIPLLEGDTEDKEIWIVYKVLRGHKEDVYDLCWSVSGSKLFSGSVDNTAILWDLDKGKMDHILSEHKGFVQGVAWDPKNEIIASLSTDRVCRVFDTTGKQIKARISKGVLQVPKEHPLYGKEVKYFHDDTFKSFFRRLQFSPDGSLLIVPSGHIDRENGKKALNGTLVFTLDNFSVPAAILPLKKQSSTVIRCCPVLFELHDFGPDPILNLPYRMIFAVGTDHDVLLYDSQQLVPFARFQDIHYTRLTDLTWSNDGLLLVASSTDGFCCLITFEDNELGVPYVKNYDELLEESVLDVSGCDEVEKDENIDVNNKDTNERDSNKDAAVLESQKRPSFLEQWALKTSANKKRKTEIDTNLHGRKSEVDTDEDCVVVIEKDKLLKDSNVVDGILEGVKNVDDSKKYAEVQKTAVVNVLVPKRREKSGVDDGKVDVKDHEDAKVIAVRRKSKEGEDMCKEDCPKIKQKAEETVAGASSENEIILRDKSVAEGKKKCTFLEQWTKKSAEKEKKHHETSKFEEKHDTNKTECTKNSTGEVMGISECEYITEKNGMNIKTEKSIHNLSKEQNTDANSEDVVEDKMKIRKETSNIFRKPEKIKIKTKDHSDAKPIAVRKKPKVQENTTRKVQIISEKEKNTRQKEECSSQNVGNAPHNVENTNQKDEKGDGNNEEGDITEEDKMIITKELSIILSRPRKVDNQIKNYSDAKPIAVRRKPKLQEKENTSQERDTQKLKSAFLKEETLPQKDENTHQKKDTSRTPVNATQSEKSSPEKESASQKDKNTSKKEANIPQKGKNHFLKGSTAQIEPSVTSVVVAKQNGVSKVEIPGKIEVEETDKIETVCLKNEEKQTIIKKSRLEKNAKTDNKPSEVNRKEEKKRISPNIHEESDKDKEKMKQSPQCTAVSTKDKNKLIKNEEKQNENVQNSIKNKVDQDNNKDSKNQKRRPISILEQWVQVTPLKKPKNDTEKQEKGVKIKVDIEVIEITDSSSPKKQHFESQSCDINQQHKEKTPKKVKRIVPKKIGEISKIINSEEKTVNNTKEEKTKKTSNIGQISKKKSNALKEEVIQKTDDKESVMKQEKQRTIIKVSSLTEKNYRKGGKKQSTPFCKLGKRSKLRSNLLLEKEPPKLDLSIEEARDSWKCLEIKSTHNEDRTEKMDVIDDCTEDFTLQLEESQGSNGGNGAKTKEGKQVSEEEIVISDEENVISEKKNKISEEKNQICYAKNIISGEENISSEEKNIISEDIYMINEEELNETDPSNDEEIDKKSVKTVEKKESLTQKVPRRVELITISSPKGKKKGK